MVQGLGPLPPTCKTRMECLAPSLGLTSPRHGVHWEVHQQMERSFCFPPCHSANEINKTHFKNYVTMEHQFFFKQM